MNHTVRSILALGATLAATLVIAPIASANVECVGFAAPAADCTTSHAAGALQTALNAAAVHAGVDTVRIAAGTYTGAFSFTTADADRIIGAGQGQTILANPVANTTSTMSIIGTVAPVEVSDLSIERTNGASGVIGFALTNGFVDHVTVRVVAVPTVNTRAASVDDSVMQRSIIEVGGDNATGFISSSTSTIEDSTITPLGTDTDRAVSFSASATQILTLRRTRIGDASGVNSFAVGVSADSAQVVLEDSMIDLGDRVNAAGVAMANSNPGVTALSATVHNSTIVGTGNNQTAVGVGTDNPGEALTVDISNSVFDTEPGTSRDVQCYRQASGTLTSFSVTNTAFDLPVVSTGDTACASTGTGNIDTGATTPADLFRAPVSHDFRPKVGGPLIDAGNPAFAGMFDLVSNTRVRDGDGAGGPAAVVDMGAYEYQRAAPVVTAGAAPLAALTGGVITFSGSAADLVDGEAASITGWTFGDGASSATATATHAYATAGTYTATATGTDSAGVTATATVLVTITAPVIAPPADTTKPVLSALGPLKALPFLRSGKAFAMTTGTNARALRLKLSEAATVKVTLARKVGKKYVTLKGTQTFALPKGSKRITWTGKWNRVLQPVGIYRITLVPTDRAKNVGVARKVLVKLVLPPKRTK